MNDAQAAANRAADEAINLLVAAYDLLDPGYVVTSWMLVLASEHAERPRQTGYAHAFSGGYMQPHVSIGMLSIAQDQILGACDEEEDE